MKAKKDPDLMDEMRYRAIISKEQQHEMAARALHAETTVVLGYNNIPLKVTEEGFDPSCILGGKDLCATSMHRLILGGVKVIVWAPGIPFWNASWRALGGRAKVEFHKKQFEVMNELGKLTGGILQVARNTSEIREINEAGGIAVLLHLSGVCHLNDMGVLREYYNLGVRIIHCAFQDMPEDSESSDMLQYGVVPHERIHYGGNLNEHGIRTIEEIKRLGIVVDVAHLLPEGFDDVVARLDGIPFIYSHGGCGALYKNERNFDDRRIEKIAKNGGVYGIGVCLGPDIPREGKEENRQKLQMLSENRVIHEQEISIQAKNLRDYIRLRYSDWNCWEERQLAILKAHAPKMSIKNLICHMQYLKENFGPEIIGYGPDYESTYQYVRGLEEADKTPNLTRKLMDEGWFEAEVQGVMGHNFMRVFEKVLR